MRWQISTLKARLFLLLMLILAIILVVIGLYLLQYVLAIREIFIVIVNVASGGIYG